MDKLHLIKKYCLKLGFFNVSDIIFINYIQTYKDVYVFYTKNNTVEDVEYFMVKYETDNIIHFRSYKNGYVIEYESINTETSNIKECLKTVKNIRNVRVIKR